MTIIAHSNVSTHGSGPYITVDRNGRLCLSAGLRVELGFPEKGHVPLYVGYDKVNKRIGIVKSEVVRLIDVVPYKFDVARGYAMARKFLRDNDIRHDKAARYIYVGDENGWRTYQLEGYEAPDQQHQPPRTRPKSTSP